MFFIYLISWASTVTWMVIINDGIIIVLTSGINKVLSLEIGNKVSQGNCLIIKALV